MRDAARARVINGFRSPRGSAQLVYKHNGITHLAASKCLWWAPPENTPVMPRGTRITCLWCMRDWP